MLLEHMRGLSNESYARAYVNSGLDCAMTRANIQNKFGNRIMTLFVRRLGICVLDSAPLQLWDKTVAE